MPSIRVALLAVSVVLGVGAQAWSQTPLLDQEFDAVPGPGSVGGTGVGFTNSSELAQTFTVGITGILGRLDLQVFVSTLVPSGPAQDLIVEIRPTEQGVPSADLVLARVTVVPSAVPLDVVYTQIFTSVDFSASQLQVTEGSVLAIVLRTFETQSGYFWTTKENATYSGGSAFFRNALVPDWSSADRTGGIPVDSGFRTFVEPMIPSIEDVIGAANRAVADSTLVGAGPGGSRTRRLKAWLNMLNAAQQMIELGNIVEACTQLQHAYVRVDGVSRPPDFVTGEAAPLLAGMIQALRNELGCVPH